MFSRWTFAVGNDETWGTEELRRFLCGVIAYTPGVLGIRLLCRWVWELGEEQVEKEGACGGSN